EISIFFEEDDYVENYEKIASSQLSALEVGGENPFMNELHWEALEESTLKLVLKYLKSKDELVLDVGVGTGRFLSKLPSNIQKFGIDISISMLHLAKSKRINVCMGSGEDLPYSDNVFDLIVSTDVLEHVLDLNAVLKEIIRVLKPGGIFILRVPYKEDLKSYVNNKDFKYVHLRRFDEYGLQLMLNRVFKLTVLEFNTCGGNLNRYVLKKYLPNIFIIVFLLCIHSLKFVNKKLWWFFASYFYPDDEINMVCQKPVS
ncbi:class I SAM-dependent methyltransferase, partial [Flavobacteriales bacterium]|nr:class I SAM-dependent methyltransferase [Flavobacteriales bacterium]